MADRKSVGADRLRQLIDRLPAMVAYWDGDLRNVVANEAHKLFFGKTPEEIHGQHIFELLIGELGEVSRPYVEAAMAGRDQIFEKTLTDHNGLTRHVQASYLPDVVGGQVRGLYVQVADVTARVEAERARDDAQLLLRISRENAPFGEAIFTTEGRALYVNPSLCRLLGYDIDDAGKLGHLDVVHPQDRDAAERAWRELVDGVVPHVFAESRYIKRAGTTIWLQRNSVLVPSAHGGADVVLSQFQDVTDRRAADAEIARLAVTDQLTGLRNRHSLEAQIAEHHAGDPSALVGIVFVDLDGFKVVNDVHGHAAGDAVLQAAARRLADAVASPNLIYRLGGDEFVVLVVDSVTKTQVASLAERVGSVLTGSYSVEGKAVSLTASVGWTCSATNSISKLIQEADLNMYRHKAQRRTAAEETGPTFR